MSISLSQIFFKNEPLSPLQPPCCSSPSVYSEAAFRHSGERFHPFHRNPTSFPASGCPRSLCQPNQRRLRVREAKGAYRFQPLAQQAIAVEFWRKNPMFRYIFLLHHLFFLCFSLESFFFFFLPITGFRLRAWPLEIICTQIDRTLDLMFVHMLSV